MRIDGLFWRLGLFFSLLTGPAFSDITFVDPSGRIITIPDDYSLADIARVYRQSVQASGPGEAPTFETVQALVRDAVFAQALIAHQDELARMSAEQQRPLRQKLWRQAVELESQSLERKLSSVRAELYTVQSRVFAARKELEDVEAVLAKRQDIGARGVRVTGAQVERAEERRAALRIELAKMEPPLASLRSLVKHLEEAPRVLQLAQQQVSRNRLVSRATVDCNTGYAQLTP